MRTRAMKSWIVSGLGVGLLLVCGASQALAHGGGWGYPPRGVPYGGHHAHWRGYGAPGVAYGYGGCGPRAVGVPYGYGYGYGTGYGYGYPAAGFGVGTRNFSFWLQQ